MVVVCGILPVFGAKQDTEYGRAEAHMQIKAAGFKAVFYYFLHQLPFEPF